MNIEVVSVRRNLLAAWCWATIALVLSNPGSKQRFEEKYEYNEILFFEVLSYLLFV